MTEYLTSVHKAVDNMLADQGLDCGPTIANEFELPEYFDLVPNGEKIDWAKVAAFLDKLSDEDLETLTQGEQSDMNAIARKGGAEGQYTHHALDTIFLSL